MPKTIQEKKLIKNEKPPQSHERERRNTNTVTRRTVMMSRMFNNLPIFPMLNNNFFHDDVSDNAAMVGRKVQLRQPATRSFGSEKILFVCLDQSLQLNLMQGHSQRGLTAKHKITGMIT
jgi:hypothetical protein